MAHFSHYHRLDPAAYRVSQDLLHRADGEPPSMITFMLRWMGFNGWMAAVTGCERDFEMINALVVEARGSFAAKVSDASMARAAEQKYLRQVRPYIDKMSVHGRVIHGYALAFGSRPGSSTPFLRVSQTRRPPPSSITAPTSSPGSPTVPASLAMATYRSNFILMQALPVADWIDWLSGARDVPKDSDSVEFIRFAYAGRTFLASAASLLLPFDPIYWRDWDFDGAPLLWRRRHLQYHLDRLNWFMMEEAAAVAFLDGLSGRIRAGERGQTGAFELPRSDVVGFGAALRDRPDSIRREGYDYALFRDGLALIGGPPPKKFEGIRTWHPKEGMH